MLHTSPRDEEILLPASLLTRAAIRPQMTRHITPSQHVPIPNVMPGNLAKLIIRQLKHAGVNQMLTAVHANWPTRRLNVTVS
jgi:hypothetical protein